MFDLSHATIIKVQYRVQLSKLKNHKRSNMIETHFYRLYSEMNGSKIIAGS